MLLVDLPQNDPKLTQIWFFSDHCVATQSTRYNTFKHSFTIGVNGELFVRSNLNYKSTVISTTSIFVFSSHCIVSSSNLFPSMEKSFVNFHLI